MNKPAPAATKLRVSQIIVQLVLLDDHDAPIQPDPVSFVGNNTGTAADNLAVWVASLPLHLAAAAVQLADTNGASDA